MARKVKVRSHSRGKVRVKAYCRRRPNRTIRPGSKRYKEMPF